MRPRNIELRIEELVLHGFASGDRYRVGDAIECELARLFVEKGTPPSLTQQSEIEGLVGGTFEVEPGFGLEVIGAKVAQAAYGKLST